MQGLEVKAENLGVSHNSVDGIGILTLAFVRGPLLKLAELTSW